jgi:hypothetical protein
MSEPLKPSIREALLAEIKAQERGGPLGGPLQQSAVLDAAAKKLGANYNPSFEQAILTQWSDLFRTGLLAGVSIYQTPTLPFFT